MNEITTHDDNPSESKLRRRAWKYRATYGLDGAAASADQTLALSLERITDRATGEAERRWDTDAVALEYRGAYANGLDVQFGVRHDDNSRFQSKTTWNAGVSWRVEGTPWRLHASAGTGLSNPQYYQIIGGFGSIGNPDLKPEESRSVDLGVEYTLPDGRGTLDLTWFRERLEDEIEWSGVPSRWHQLSQPVRHQPPRGDRGRLSPRHHRQPDHRRRLYLSRCDRPGRLGRGAPAAARAGAERGAAELWRARLDCG